MNVLESDKKVTLWHYRQHYKNLGAPKKTVRPISATMKMLVQIPALSFSIHLFNYFSLLFLLLRRD